MKKAAPALLLLAFAAVLVWADSPQSPGGSPELAAIQVKGRPAKASVHLLDRGASPGLEAPLKGGTSPPTGPTTIAYLGGGPGAVAAGATAAGAFPGPGLGGYFGNIFAPGAGFPSSFLTLGATPGFLVTGAYAWHSPFFLTTMGAAAPGGSPARILVAAAALTPPTAFAPVPTGGFATALTAMFPGPPGPAAVVGAPGIFPGVRVGGTAMTGGPTPATASAVFCGMIAGGPGFTTMWTGNGLGASLPPMGPGVPLRIGFFPPFFTPGVFPISAAPAPPQDFIAGCFADSSTTPVELMAFGVE